MNLLLTAPDVYNDKMCINIKRRHTLIKQVKSTENGRLSLAYKTNEEFVLCCVRFPFIYSSSVVLTCRFSRKTDFIIYRSATLKDQHSYRVQAWDNVQPDSHYNELKQDYQDTDMKLRRSK